MSIQQDGKDDLDDAYEILNGNAETREIENLGRDSVQYQESEDDSYSVTRRGALAIAGGAAAGLAGCNTFTSQDRTTTPTESTDVPENTEEETETGTTPNDEKTPEPESYTAEDVADSYIEGADIEASGQNTYTDDQTEIVLENEGYETREELGKDILGNNLYNEDGEISEENLDRANAELERQREENGLDHLQYVTEWYNSNFGEESEADLSGTKLEDEEVGYDQILGVFNTARESDSESFDVLENLETSLRDSENSIDSFETVFGAYKAGEKFDDSTTVSESEYLAEAAKVVNGIEAETKEKEIEHLGYEAAIENMPEDPFSDDWTGDNIDNLTAMELGLEPTERQELFAEDEKFEGASVESRDGDRYVVFNYDNFDVERTFSEWEAHRNGAYQKASENMDLESAHDSEDWHPAELKQGMNTEFKDMMMERVDEGDGSWQAVAEQVRTQTAVEVNRMALAHRDINPGRVDQMVGKLFEEDNLDALKRSAVIGAEINPEYLEEGHTNESFEAQTLSYKDAVDYETFAEHGYMQKTFGDPRPPAFGPDKISSYIDMLESGLPGGAKNPDRPTKVVKDMNERSVSSSGTGGDGSDSGTGSTGGRTGGGGINAFRDAINGGVL